METKSIHQTILFIPYTIVTFLNLQYKIQLTDTTITDNLSTQLKIIGKLIFWYKILSKLISIFAMNKLSYEINSIARGFIPDCFGLKINQEI